LGTSRRLRWDGGHGDRDEAGRATPVDRRRNAALRRARAAPVAVVVGRVERTDQQIIALAPAWMQDEGIARETIAMSMLVAMLGGLALQVPIASSRTALTGVSCWPSLALALRAPPPLWSF